MRAELYLGGAETWCEAGSLTEVFFESSPTEASFELTCIVPSNLDGGGYSIFAETFFDPGSTIGVGEMFFTVTGPGPDTAPEITISSFTSSVEPEGVILVSGSATDEREVTRVELRAGAPFDCLPNSVTDQSFSAPLVTFELRCNLGSQVACTTADFMVIVSDSASGRASHSWPVTATGGCYEIEPPAVTLSSITTSVDPGGVIRVAGSATDPSGIVEATIYWDFAMQCEPGSNETMQFESQPTSVSFDLTCIVPLDQESVLGSLAIQVEDPYASFQEWSTIRIN